MIWLFLASLAVLAALALGIMYLIGIFNKRVNGHANLIVGFIRTLKINWRNIRNLPSRLWLLARLLPRKRRLIFMKILKRIKASTQTRRQRRRERRRARKLRRQHQRNN